jgi:hypothetical protein
MPKPTSITIGLPLPGIPTLSVVYEERVVSLQPFDLILVNPIPLRPDVDVISTYHTAWKTEITMAASAGRTVVVFLNRFEQEDYGGRPCHNFEFLPTSTPPLIAMEGKDIQLSNATNWVPIWTLLKPFLSYSVGFDGTFSTVLGLSKHHQKPVAGIQTMGKGRVILLPQVDWDHPDLLEDDSWTDKGIKLAETLVDYLSRI